MLVDLRVAVPDGGETTRHGPQGEVLRPAFVQLLPGERRRDPCVGPGAHRVGAGHRAILGVLVVVEEDAVAFLLPPLAGRQAWSPPLDFPGECQRGASHLRERPAGVETHVDVDAPRARGLRPAHEAEVGQRPSDHPHHRLELRPLDARDGIEVDPELIGMLELFRAYGMRMELEAAEVRHPGQRRRVARHHLFGDAAGREAKGDDLDPCRPRGGRALLVEGLAVDPVGIADEDVRPVTRAPQRALGHGKVVADDLQLGDPGFREVDLARVRDRDLAAGDLDRRPLGFARRHPAQTYRGIGPSWGVARSERSSVTSSM